MHRARRRCAHPCGSLSTHFNGNPVILDKLSRPEHAGFVDDENVLGGEQLTIIGPLMLETGDSARGDTGTAFKTVGNDAGQRGTAHLISGGLHASRAPSVALLPDPA